jgi:hypothetical protein
MTRAATPVLALQATLSHGSPFGEANGPGLVASGYPSAGWVQVAGSSGSATFQARLGDGTAQLKFSRVSGKWALTEGQKNC